MANKPFQVSPDNAAKIRKWFETRGGILIWDSQVIGDNRSWTTPLCLADGSYPTDPHWSVKGCKPREITDPKEVVVAIPKLVRRFHVGVRMGAQGMSLKLRDASGRRLIEAVKKAGEDAWYAFDYEAQDALIFVPDRLIPLMEYKPEPVADPSPAGKAVPCGQENL